MGFKDVIVSVVSYYFQMCYIEINIVFITDNRALCNHDHYFGR